MQTGTLRAIAVACGLTIAATLSGGCASKGQRPLTREEQVRARLSDTLGFQGRMRTVHLGQATGNRLRAGATRLDGGLLLFEDVHHRLSALDRNAMMPRWEYHGISEPLRYPATSSDIAVVAMSGNRLYQVDRTWGHAMGGAVYFDLSPSAPFVATAGTAYVPTWGGRGGQKTLTTLNLVTGLRGWGFRTPGDIRGAMAIGGDAPRQIVYFATDAGEVYALPAVGADGDAPEPLWMHTCRGGVTADLHLAGEDLFVSCHDSALYCIDRITGNVRWASYLDAPLKESAVATASAVYIHTPGGLHCLDRATGAVRWSLAEGVRFVVERDGLAVVQTGGGALAAVRADGSVAVRTDGGRYFYPTNTADETLYAVADDGYVVSLDVGGE